MKSELKFDQSLLKGDIPPTNSIYAISIVDLQSQRIYFLNKIAQLDYTELKRNVNALIFNTFLELRRIRRNSEDKASFIFKSKSHRYINNRVKVYTTIIHGISIFIFYNATQVDDFQMRIYNQRLIDTLMTICGTKLITVQMLVKRYHDVNIILDEVIFLMDPRMRLNFNKKENMLMKDIIMHSNVMCKVKGNLNVVKTFYYYGCNREFKNTLINLDNVRKMRNRFLYGDIRLVGWHNTSISAGVEKVVKGLAFNSEMSNFFKKNKKINFTNTANTSINSINPLPHFIKTSFNPSNNTGISTSVNSMKQSRETYDFNLVNKSVNLNEMSIDFDFLAQNLQKTQNKNDVNITKFNSTNSKMNLSTSKSKNFDFDLDFFKANNNVSESKFVTTNIHIKKEEFFSFEFDTFDLNKNKTPQTTKNIIPNITSVNTFSSVNNFNFGSKKNTINLLEPMMDEKLFKNMSLSNSPNKNYKKEEDEKIVSDFIFDSKFVNDLNKSVSIYNGRSNSVLDTNRSLNSQNNNESSNIYSNFNMFNFYNHSMEGNDTYRSVNSNISTSQHKICMNSVGEIKKKSDFGDYPDLPDEAMLFSDFDSNRKDSINTHCKPLASLDFSSFYKPVLESKGEDVFDPLTISTKLRGAITEKGYIKYNKGKFEEANFKGQVMLELKSGFEIKNKIIHVKIINDKWTDDTCFSKEYLDKENIEKVNDNPSNLRVFCKNLKNSIKLVLYSINTKLLDSFVDVKFKNDFSITQKKLKVELFLKVIKSYIAKLKNCELKIEIHFNKNKKFEIYKSSNTYHYEPTQSNIIYTIDNFNKKENFGLGLILDTEEENLISLIKLRYYYMDFIPSFTSINMTYLDTLKMTNHLTVLKRCVIEKDYYL